MLKSLFVILLFLLSHNSVSFSQGGGVIIGNNYRIFPSNVSQSEVFITRHPNDPQILFASANTLKFQPSFFISEGVYVTKNGGNSWFGSDTCKGANIFFHGGDPAIGIDKNGTFMIARKGSTSFPGVFSHRSTDYGNSWSSQKAISNDELERASMVNDNNPNSNFYGRTYICWAKLVPPYNIGFSYSNDGAQSWLTPFPINNPTIRGAGGEVAVGPNGEVYVCWAGLTSTSPFTEIQVGFASSTNGGINWSVTENAFTMNGIVGPLTTKQNIRVNGLPRMAIDVSNSIYKGTIYIVTSQKNLSPAGSDPDIILRKSTDQGQSWSQGIRVNQDQLNNGKIQFFPAIHVDDYGGVNIIFYDDRNTTSDSSGVLLARSTDGGISWNEFEISDHKFKPTAIGGLGQGYMGDNIDMTSIGNKLHPVWMDNSTGIYQIWSTQIEFPLVGIENENENFITPSFELKQNYPNPFNPITTISWQSPISAWHILKVYDILGNEVSTLVNEWREADSHSVQFYAEGLSSGIYYYKLVADKFSESKVMIFLK